MIFGKKNIKRLESELAAANLEKQRLKGEIEILTLDAAVSLPC